MLKTEEGFELRLRPRAMETVSIDIPKDALESLKKVAAIRDMSEQALLRFYVGLGLRQDLSRLFAGTNDDLRSEYNLSELLEGGVRGKYAERFRAGKK